MDAGPSSPPQLSSTTGTYSDADSEFASDEFELEVDGSPQDGVSVEARAAASDYSDEYEEEVLSGKGKAKKAFNAETKSSRFRARVNKTVHKAEKEARSWSDLDVSMIIALLSPVGNWLTGSDHVKNLFLLILLVFYLHQLIEGASSYHVSCAASLTSLKCPGDYTRARVRVFPHAMLSR